VELLDGVLQLLGEIGLAVTPIQQGIDPYLPDFVSLLVAAGWGLGLGSHGPYLQAERFDYVWVIPCLLVYSDRSRFLMS
jgi:hypothetical protein